MVDRTGYVLSVRLERGSGYGALDEEALDLLERAQPLPSIPDSMADETLEIVVPVEFSLR
jgi:protein TonB